MPRPSNTVERRAQIVEGLRQAMAVHGYERASVQAVARAAGLSPGLVHYHFANKEEILLALVESLMAGVRARIDARLSVAGEQPRERLGAYLDAILAVGEGADPAAVATWALVGAEAVRLPEVGQIYERWLLELRRELEVLLAAACRDEARSRRGIRALAVGVLSLVEGYFRIAAGAPGVVPAGTAAPTARRMAFGLLDAQPPEAEGRAR